MARGIDRELEQRWRDRLDKYGRSGMRIVEFCRSAGIPQQSFFHWRRELAKRDGQSRGSGLPNHGPQQQQQRKDSPSIPAFVPVEVIEPHTSGSSRHLVEVALSNGIILRVPVGSDPTYVQCLVAALGAKSC